MKSPSDYAFIYSLSYKGEVRYIGRTVQSLHDRLKDHLRTARKGEGTYRGNWIRSIDYQPTIDLVAIVPEHLMVEAESHWIQTYRQFGHHLVNDNDGAGSLRMSEQTKKKISAANKGRKLTPEQYERMNRNRPHVNTYLSPEQRKLNSQKAAEKLRGRSHPPERVEANRVAQNRSEVVEKRRRSLIEWHKKKKASSTD